MSSNGPWRPPAETTGPAEPAPPPPQEIHNAWVLWLAATGFALLGMLLNVATTRLEDLPAATRDAIRQAAEDAGDAAPPLDTLFTVAMGVGAVFALVAAAVTVWLAFRLRVGRRWARTMLDIVAIFLLVDAVSVVIGVFGDAVATGSRGAALTFVVFACQILAGLCAATAVWRQHTAEATTFITGGDRAGD